MTTAVVDSPESEQAQPWWFPDACGVEHRRTLELDSVVLEATLPVGLAPALHEDVRSEPRPRREPRWVPDPRGQQALICVWVPGTGA